jgi:hypothetical protein
MDNHYVQLASSHISCGVLEAYGLTEEPRNILYGIATRLYHPSRGAPAAFVIWSDVATIGSRGEQLATLIGSEFGEPVPREEAENPLTGNRIELYVWTVRHEYFREWYKKERIARLKKL